MHRKKKSIAWLYLLPVTVLIALLVFSSYRALRVYLPQWREQRGFAELREALPTEPPEASEASEEISTTFVNRYKSVMEKNGDFACWLKIPDTAIDYPVMKTSEDDPEYYLRRDFNKKYSIAGCLFIGGGCNLDSDSFVIYGHNMDTDSMFGALDRYADPDYALEHRLIRIGTPTENRRYRVFAAFQTKIYDENANVFKYYERIGSLDEPTYLDTVSNIRTMSMIDLADAPQYPAQLLFLSTCSYHTKDGRFVVAAYRVEPGKKS